MPYSDSSQCCCGSSALSTRSPETTHTIQYLPKVVWILIIIFIPTLGSIVWLVVGRGHTAPRGYVGPTGYGEYERPGRAVAQDPAADEAFLRQCRKRAEEQRRIDRQRLAAGDEPDQA